jgi:hypothetical protein
MPITNLISVIRNNSMFSQESLYNFRIYGSWFWRLIVVERLSEVSEEQIASIFRVE